MRRCSPICQLYAVDMAFCGGEGLVTSKATATFIMVCSQVTHWQPTFAAVRTITLKVKGIVAYRAEVNPFLIEP